MEKRIPAGEIALHPASQCDPNGRVFTWRGDVYRALTKRGAEIAQKLFDADVIESLMMKRLLVETERTGLQLEGFELVLKHRRLPVITWPMEWCGRMFQEALVLIADLQIELAAHGFEIEGNDAGPWNVLFDGHAPRWIDFGALIPAGPQGAAAHPEFLLRGVEPLALLTGNGHRVARWSMQDYRPSRCVSPSEYGSLHPLGPEGQFWGKITRRIARSRKKTGTATANDFRYWKNKILQTRLPQAAISSALRDPEISAALAEERASTALLLGDRARAYLEAIARNASRVVAISESEAEANALHNFAREKSLAVHSLVMRMHNPSPGLGIANEEFAPASTRLASDLVFASGLVEDLIFHYLLHFEQVTRTLALFSRKRLLLEFLPFAMVPPARIRTSHAAAWYSRDALRDSLRERFAIVQEREVPATGGCLFVCETLPAVSSNAPPEFSALSRPGRSSHFSAPSETADVHGGGPD